MPGDGDLSRETKNDIHSACLAKVIYFSKCRNYNAASSNSGKIILFQSKIQKVIIGF